MQLQFRLRVGVFDKSHNSLSHFRSARRTHSSFATRSGLVIPFRKSFYQPDRWIRIPFGDFLTFGVNGWLLRCGTPSCACSRPGLGHGQGSTASKNFWTWIELVVLDMLQNISWWKGYRRMLFSETSALFVRERTTPHCTRPVANMRQKPSIHVQAHANLCPWLCPLLTAPICVATVP